MNDMRVETTTAAKALAYFGVTEETHYAAMTAYTGRTGLPVWAVYPIAKATAPEGEGT